MTSFAPLAHGAQRRITLTVRHAGYRSSAALTCPVSPENVSVQVAGGLRNGYRPCERATSLRDVPDRARLRHLLRRHGRVEPVPAVPRTPRSCRRLQASDQAHSASVTAIEIAFFMSAPPRRLSAEQARGVALPLAIHLHAASPHSLCVFMVVDH